MTAHAIEATDLRFSYGDHEAVAGVSFSVSPGEILGFLGPNGAGKSTTIKMLTGQLRPKSGTVMVLGMDMVSRPEEIHGRMGVCFEEKNLYNNMSARENLDFFAELFGIRIDAGEHLRRVDLADRADDRVSGFSKGMRQRLMMARALLNTPDVLFLDEPTDGLDPVSAASIKSLIRSEAARGAAVLLTTHDMHEADQLSDRVAFINEGQILALDKPEELKLAHGRRSVKVRRRDGEGVDELTIPLDGDGSSARLAALMDDRLMSIHTEEATLEDVFITFAGRGLEG
jgi:ABC-type multidrug transport system ATPase subunit